MPTIMPMSLRAMVHYRCALIIVDDVRYFDDVACLRFRYDVYAFYAIFVARDARALMSIIADVVITRLMPIFA